MIKLSKAIENSNLIQLNALLEKGEVTTGFWRGRKISVPGYQGFVTFSQIAARIKALYEPKMIVHRQRYNDYQKFQNQQTDFMPIRGKFSIIPNILFLPWTLVGHVFLETSKTLYPHPEVTRREESELTNLLQSRRKIDTSLNELFLKSQKEIDHAAAKSCRAKISRRWDQLLNSLSSWRNQHIHDDVMIEQMAQARINNFGRRFLLATL